jgi:hypothetical protein
LTNLGFSLADLCTKLPNNPFHGRAEAFWLNSGVKIHNSLIFMHF